MTNVISFATRLKSVDGKSAFEGLVKYEVSSGAGLAEALVPVLVAYTADDAKDILISVNAEVAKRRSRPGAPVEPAPVTDQRLSATRGLWKMTEWKCWQAYLTNASPYIRNWDDAITLSNWLRSKKLGQDKDNVTPPAPAAIAERMAERNQRGPKVKLPALEAVRRAPTKTLDSAIEGLTNLATLEGNGKGAAFLSTALKALQSYRPSLAIREEEAEIAAVKAKHEAARRAKQDGK